ncbi:hypothetical protein KP509_08G046400 [Ceratopteris richardii]|uniref:Uncharacterized protein n=1 Tax=Ceratopteris richardii TaxID=49495 RepID=A0A8T2UDN3_CERRI|nr:hypothetical protein KP509_08G046400 [Ceratopteris richardii]
MTNSSLLDVETSRSRSSFSRGPRCGVVAEHFCKRLDFNKEMRVPRLQLMLKVTLQKSQKKDQSTTNGFIQ